MEAVDDSAQARHVRDYLTIVWRRKFICIFVFILVSSVGLFVVLKMLKPWYQARARISIERLRAPLGEQGGYAGEAFYQTQYEIIGSSNVAALAAYKLGRSESPEQAKADGQAEIIRRAISIHPEANNRVVRIQTRQRDPEAAAALVNKVVEAYIEFARSNEEAVAKRRQKEMQDQINILELDIASLRKTIDEFTRDKKLQEQREQELMLTKRINALVEAQIPAKVAAEAAEKEYNSLKEKYDSGEDLVTNVKSAEADRINAQIREIEMQMHLMGVGKTEQALETDARYLRHKELKEQYTREYSDAMEEARREANLRELERARTAMERNRKIEQTYQRQLAEVRTKVAQLVKGLTALARYEELQKELENHIRMRDGLKQELLTARLSDDMAVLNITVLDEARPPTEPAWPNKVQLSVVVLVLALMSSVGMAFFLDYMDRSVHRPEDVEQELRMPFMGFIPGTQSAGNNSFRQEKVLLTDPTSGPAESYRKIRAKLNIYRGESHARTFAVTSTTAGEGKTSLTTNLALSFAQSNLSVLLVDADMRHPKVHEIFEIERIPGLGDYLDGECTWESVVRSSGVAGLSIIPAGTGGSRSAELLESPRLRELLEESSAKFDILVVDTPPVLGVADAAILCNATDGTIFVIQAARNSKWLIRRAGMELKAADARVVGAVLNRVRSQRGDYYYYHQYYPKKT